MSLMTFLDLTNPVEQQDDFINLDHVTSDGFMIPQANAIPLETQEKLDGIELGIESITAISKIMKVVKESEQQTPSMIKLTNIAVEQIKRNVGIFKDGTIVAMECVSHTSISLEGLGDIIKSIWDAIVRTFKSIWNTVRSLFVKSKTEVAKASAHKTATDFEHLVKQAEKKDFEKPDVTLGELEFLNRPFSYLKDNCNVPTLIEELEKLIHSVRGCENLLKTLELANANMEVAIDKFNKNGIDSQSVGFADEAISTYYRAIGDAFVESTDLSDYKEILSKKLSIDYNNVDRKSVCALNGLTRGAKVFAFHVKNDNSENEEYQFLTVYEELNDIGPVNLQFKFDGNIKLSHAYAEKVGDCYDELASLIGLYENKCNHMLQRQERILKHMGDFIHRKDSTGNSDAIPERMVTYQNVTRALVKATLSLTTFIAFTERSTDDHRSMAKYLYKKWNAAVNSVD